jgi:hypothetical protein
MVIENLHTYQMYYWILGLTFAMISIKFYWITFTNHPQFGLLFQSSLKARLIIVIGSMVIIVCLWPLFMAELIGTGINKLINRSKKTQGGK